MSIKPKNLEEKVGILLDEIERLPRQDALRKLTAFVLNELDWKDTEFILDDYDLSTVRSIACKMMSEFPTHKVREYGFESNYGIDQDKLRALCWIEAVVSFFRGNKLIPFKTSFKSKNGRG